MIIIPCPYQPPILQRIACRVICQSYGSLRVSNAVETPFLPQIQKVDASTATAVRTSGLDRYSAFRNLSSLCVAGIRFQSVKNTLLSERCCPALSLTTISPLLLRSISSSEGLWLRLPLFHYAWWALPTTEHQ